MQDRDLYFAYGSNLKAERMHARVASARVVGPARLPGFRLALDKHGRDGTGKANVHADPGDGACVWGVVYAIDARHWPALDAHEGGYERVTVDVFGAAGEAWRATTYRSGRLLAEPVALDWYVRLIVEGAREHGLPDAWIALLERLPRQPVPI